MTLAVPLALVWFVVVLFVFVPVLPSTALNCTLQAQIAVPRGMREASARENSNLNSVQASSLPANSATQMATPTKNVNQAGITQSPDGNPDTRSGGDAAAPSRLDLQYANGQMAIDATDVSLNRILREIVARTGLKISGGVTDQKVYGHYGPASVALVIASLLDGTGSNMLLVNDAKGPSQLILSPRQGGPSPPGPLVAEPQPYNSYAERQGRGGFLGARADGDPAVPPTSYQPPAGEGVSAAAQSAPDSATENGANGANTNGGGPQSTPSPNGTKTPQQIYQELLQMRQNSTSVPAATPQPK